MAWLSEVLRRGPRRAIVAAVPVRISKVGRLEFLLVRTSKGGRWTFPKGGVDLGETPAPAAAREALEEGGVSGTIMFQPLAVYGYDTARKDRVDVTAFLLEVDRDGLPAELGRAPTWFGFEAARSRLVEGHEAGYGEEMERVLRSAERAAHCARRSCRDVAGGYQHLAQPLGSDID
ncbi:MAG: NUDIX domain-containing protein [Solirubrobacteraceae bacterium]